MTPWVDAIARYKLIDFLRRNRASIANVPIDEANEVTANDDQARVSGPLHRDTPSLSREICFLTIEGFR